MTQPQPTSDRQVRLQKIYVADASVEVPDGPKVFAGAWQPKIDVDLNFSVRDLGAARHLVCLQITVTASSAATTAYVVQVEQVGLFQLAGFDQTAERQRVLGVYCTGILFPYARETVGDLVQRAGFPHFLLQPMDFEDLYQRHLDAQQREPSPARERSH
ncbi:MAG: protein-export chaperone SecB [Salinisphaera sp.]|nr:protein-export chaperone SecB [Salinisphaera sp.]